MLQFNGDKVEEVFFSLRLMHNYKDIQDNTMKYSIGCFNQVTLNNQPCYFQIFQTVMFLLGYLALMPVIYNYFSKLIHIFGLKKE